MLLKTALIFMLISAATCKPQLLTFRDGKVGVNFGGYHAEAGLGGILTGNAAHGGLSASAGTPYGQRAAAGIGGSLDGRTLGGAYAGAEAGNGIGASAGLAGSVGEGGVLEAESHSGGYKNGVIKMISAVEPTIVDDGHATVVQKVKPPVKQHVDVIENHVTSDEKHLTRTAVSTPTHYYDKEYRYIVEKQPVAAAAPPPVVVYRKRIRPLRRRVHFHKYYVPVVQEVNKVDTRTDIVKERPVVQVAAAPAHEVQVIKRKQYFTTPLNADGSTFFDSIFNIPISTLRAVNGFLNQGFGSGGGIQKSVEIHKS